MTMYAAQDPFYIVETACVAWFSVEFVMRLVASPSKRQFSLDVMNVFDVLAIVPYFVVLVVQHTEGNCEMAKRSGTFVIIRVLRIFRIFKLSKHSQVEIARWRCRWTAYGVCNPNALPSRRSRAPCLRPVPAARGLGSFTVANFYCSLTTFNIFTKSTTIWESLFSNYKDKGKGRVLDIALLHDGYMLRSALQSEVAADWHDWHYAAILPALTNN